MMFPMRYSFYEFLPFYITGCIRLVEYKAICNAYITLKKHTKHVIKGYKFSGGGFSLRLYNLLLFLLYGFFHIEASSLSILLGDLYTESGTSKVT